MLQHNLLLIYRNFKRFKTTFFINLVGLSTGLVCTLLIYLWVSDELRIDRFHETDSRLFQAMESQQHAGSIRVTDSTPWLLAEALEDEMPEVEYSAVATPTYWFNSQTLSVDDNIIKANGKYTGKDFFRIFSYDLVQGNADEVLADKSAMVISESLALKLFNATDNVIGKTVTFQQDQLYKVSGVFKDLPPASSEYFDFVLSYKNLTDMNPDMTSWGNSGPNTFIVLKEGTRMEDFNQKIAAFISTKSEDTHRTLFLTKYSDNYLYGNYENGVQSGGRIEYVTLFTIVALFILIIACINFMNLSTAKASRRIKEVGIKKAVGARRGTLVAQYLSESMFMAFLSLAVAILAVDIALPWFNEITAKNLALNFDANFALSLLGIVLFTGIISGSYPALYLSGFNPATVLKGRLDTSLGELWARKGLVVFQFTLSVILIVSVLVIYRQIEFVQNKNLGYDKENVIYFPLEGKVKTSLETFLLELEKVPGVLQASSIGQSMVGGGNTMDIDWDGKDPDQRIPFAVRPVNFGILEMLDLEIVQGRSFARQFSSDTSAVIFNEAGIEAMGMVDPVGKEINLGPDRRLHIAGVVKDFHYESLRWDISPMFFILKPEYTEKIMVKIAAGQETPAINSMQDFYRSYNPGFSFDYRFLDADYQAQYGAERRVSILSRYFAGIAILISCLGLFGLAAFTAERRRKEIGIRKVLGSSEFQIVYLLSGDFTKLVFVSILLAIPLSYLLTQQWLDNFAYKIPLEWWYFTGAGLAALCIAWFTVGMQAVKASRVNPTHCLKDE
jgi:ABC-type antimicrobial peptide transport system permease subunit